MTHILIWLCLGSSPSYHKEMILAKPLANYTIFDVEYKEGRGVYVKMTNTDTMRTHHNVFIHKDKKYIYKILWGDQIQIHEEWYRTQSGRVKIRFDSDEIIRKCKALD